MHPRACATVENLKGGRISSLARDSDFSFLFLPLYLHPNKLECPSVHTHHYSGDEGITLI